MDRCLDGYRWGVILEVKGRLYQPLHHTHNTMKALHMVTWILLVVGGLNWLLVGLGGWNLVSMIFGGVPVLEELVYVLVGLSAIYEIVTHKKHCTMCGGMQQM